MKAKNLIVALSIIAAGSAFADDVNYPYVKLTEFQSTKTRAEVKAEIAQARADGTLDIRDDEYPIIKKSDTPKTRAEVVAGIAQARADGTLDINDATYPVLPATAIAKTRAQVGAELAQYGQPPSLR